MRNFQSFLISFCLLAFAGIALSAGAQMTAPNEWTWVGGSDSVASCANPNFNGDCSNFGIYGTMGTPAGTNVPGSRADASTWIDSSGNFWLFGGSAIDSVGNNGALNDLWKFSPSTKDWTWVAGAESATGDIASNTSANWFSLAVYGTVGVPTIGNTPGGRNGAVTWTDSDGHLWLFGGQELLLLLDDLWEFYPSTGEWAWIGGTPGLYDDSSKGYGEPGAYGTLGVPAASNLPGSRSDAVSWTDNSGNFWMFAGYGLDVDGDAAALNDIWEFNEGSKLWTWMGGSRTAPCSELMGVICGQAGTYGTLGTQAADNIPGARFSAVTWKDSGGSLWLFGGYGFDASGTQGMLNDLWKFDPAANLWTWIGGSKTIPSTCAETNCGPLGLYGTLGTPAVGNMPGGRYQAVSWADSRGQLWLSGGFGVDANGTEGDLNDLWQFNPSTNEWAWMGGSTTLPVPSTVAGQPGIYGMLGVPAAGNGPGGRSSASSWIDSSDNLWLFGGSGVDNLSPFTQSIEFSGNGATFNDLWDYQPAIPSAVTPGFSVPAGTYSAIQTVTISDATAGASVYYTTDGTTPTTSSTLYSSAITVANSETLKAIGVAAEFNNSAVASAAYIINVPPDFSVTAAPVTMTVTAGGSGTETISISPQSSFASAVSFACSGVPAGAACSFSPATLTPSGPAAATTTLTVTTAATSASSHENRRPLLPDAALAGVLCFVGFRKRKGFPLLLLLGMSLTGLGLASGCGGGSSGGGSQTSTSTVTVTATSGTLIHTTTFTLVVN
jgi:N-acetylneuraminic acid mutarotase